MPEGNTKAERLRALVLASTFPRWQGDTEPAFVYNLCRGLQADFDVTVLAPHAPGASLREEWQGMEVVRFRYFWPERLERLAYGGILPNLRRNRWLWLLVPLFLAAELIAALRLVRSHRPDVIHAHWLLPQGLVAAAAGLITKTPVVITAHGGDLYGVRGRVQDALKRWALRRAIALTAVSSDLARVMADLVGGSRGSPRSGRPRVEVISMGVDTQRFRPDARDERLRRTLGVSGPFLLFVGRLAEKKGVRYLLEAMPAILGNLPAAKLVVVGDGPLRGELESLSRLLGIEESVVFVGGKRQEELPPYYATADVFIGPSIVVSGGDTESFGLVFAEAMASGCAVVASDVGGIRELVREGETGLLVPERDPAAIARAVCALLADDELRRRLAAGGRSRVKRRFEQRSIANRYARVLREAAA